MTRQCKIQLLPLTAQKHQEKTPFIRMWAQVEISDFQDDDIASVTVTGSETGIANTNDWSSQTASSTTDQTKHQKETPFVRIRHQGEISVFSRCIYEGVDIASVTVTGSLTDIVKRNDMAVKLQLYGLDCG